MKKIILALITLTIVNASCSKKQEINNSTTNVVAKKTRASKSKITETACPLGDCHVPAHDCVRLKTVVVTPSQISALNGASTATAVAALFSSTTFATIVSNLEDEFVTKLQSGSYSIVLNYEDEGTINYLVGTTNPVSFTNSEFTIAFNK